MADTTDNSGFPEDDDLFGGDNRGNNREQKGESLEDVLREGTGGDREDRSIANIHTGSKVDHESVNMAAPPEGAPPPETPEVIPEEYTPGDPPPPIDPIDVDQEAGGNYVPEERPLDFELRQRERGDETTVVEEAQEEEDVRRRFGDDESESQEELLAQPTTASEPTLPPAVDDSPETPVALNSVLDEDDLANGSDGTGARSVTQPLIIDFGDDGAGAVRLEVPQALRQMEVGPDNSVLNIELSEDGSQITAVDSEGSPVFTVTLNSGQDGYSYTFELQGSIDHGDLDQVDLPIGISVTDSDGDAAFGEFTVGIVDDEPVARDDELQSLEEGGGTVGSDNGADNLLDNDTLGADGALIFQFTYTDENGEQQTARAGETVDTENGTLTVEADGSWSFEADASIDHTDGEAVFDGFNYSIVDADGDTSSATQEIKITDDGPTIDLGDGPNGGASATLFEKDISDNDASVSNSLNIDFGADGEGSVALTIPQELEDMGLTADGNAVTYALSEDGQTITASADGETVFTMSITEGEDGEYGYTFELQGNLDHPDAGSDILSNLPFEVEVTDGDGSTATAEININVVDDQPEAVGEVTLRLEEGGNTVGSDNGGANLLANDDVGADGGEITSFVYTDENGEQQTADAGDTVDTENGTLTVNADGSWSFESDPDADHSGGDVVVDKFTYTLTDGDGDTSSAVQRIEITDDGPQIPPKAPPPHGGEGDNPDLGRADLIVDEDNMGQAVSQDIEVDFGADGFGSAALSVPSELEDMNLTSGGEAITYSVSEDGQSITATADGETVFTVDLQADAQTGELSYSVTLEGAVDHPESGASDDLLSNLPVTLTVTDGDGTEATSTLEIGIIDDTPTAVDDGKVTLEEGGDTLSVSATDGLLSNDDIGADGGEITSFTYTDENGNEQTADAGSTVDTENGTLTVNSDGSWSFESDPNADHSEGETVSDNFTYTITDGDGDTASATQSIELTDDGPQIPPKAPPPHGGEGDNPDLGRADLIVDEDNMGQAVSQDIEVDFGADGFGSAALSVPSELEDMNLTSGGEAITYSVSEDGQSITATADGETVFTVDLQADAQTGELSYSVTLEGAVDHPESGASDDLLSNLPVTLTVTDGDGTEATSTLEIGIIDDTPTAVDDGEYNLTDGNETIGTGNGSDNLLANDDIGADGGEITSFTYTDENGEQQTADAGSTVDTEQGTLTVNADGTWEFDSDDLIESADGSPVTDNFSYTITDGDGDTSSATVAINVSDGTAEPPQLVVGDGIGYEDNAIALNIDASATDTDGSESISITISGVPDGASLSAGTDNGDGTWSLEESDLEGLTVTPPTDSDIDFDLNVSVTSTEESTGATSTVDSTFTVEVDAVADTTTVSASVDAKLVQPAGETSEPITIDASNFGDTDSGFSVVGRDIDGEVDADNVVVDGGKLGVGGAAVGNKVPNQIGHNPETGEAEGIIVEFDNDVTQVDFSVSRLFQNEGGKGNDEQGRVILYRDGEVVGEVEFTAEGNHTGSYSVQADDGGTFDAIEFTATEYDESNNTNADSSDYFVDQISFTPAPEPGDGDPNCEITVNVDATFGDYTDGSENHFVVVEVPEGWDPQGEYVEVDSSSYGEGNFIAIQVDPADLQSSDGAISVPVVFQAPVPDEDGSVDVNVFAVAQEVNIDGTVGDGEITLDNNNYMSQATVTVEKKDMVAEDPDLQVDDSAGYEDNAIPLSIDASLTDTDGSESLAITISGVPEGATLSAGTDNGDGTWSLEEGDLDGLTVTPPTDSDADFDLSVSVTSTESNSGFTSTVEGEINVKVDAVADDTTIAGTSETEVGDNTVTINMNATFGDYEDGSETHVVLVEIPEGWEAPEGSTVVDGGEVDGLPDKQFVQVEVSNADLQASDGSATVSVDFIAPDDQASGDINFEVFSGAVETPSDSGEITLDNNTTYTGSTVTAEYQDGAPTVEAGEVLLSENDLGDGSTTVTGSIDIDFGADGAGSVTIAVPEELTEMELTSGGEDVTFEVSEDGQTITGSTPDGSPVMTITLNEDSGDYSYSVELQGPLDHGGDNGDLINDIPVELNVVDGFGETAQATINIDVADAIPQAVDDGVFNVTDGGNVIGTDGGQDNLLGNDDLGADGAEITSFTYTDENGETQSAEVGATVDTEQGTLTVNADGTWAFESDDLMESPDGNPVMDNFTYTITDGDGDTSTATVSINVSDGTAQPPELVVGEAEGYEDNAIPLSIETSLTDTDGSESLSITISDVPEGATLSAGTDNGDGTWTLEEDDLDGLTVTPPTDSDVDFDLSVSVTSTESSTGATSTVENTVAVKVDAVADDVDVSAEISAKVVQGEEGTETVEITADNYDAGDAGFTVKGRTLDSDGNMTEASTDTVSVKTGGSATGFGVKGDVSNGADSEIGYEDGKSEQIVVDFDQDVSSANISIAWQNPNEDCRITLYRDGEPVGEVVIEGGTDKIDALGSFQADDGGSFDQITFEATGDNSDFLVNSIEFEVATPAEPACEVEVDLTASFGDYTDGSEEHFVFVEVPEGMTPSDQDAITVEGNSENGLPAGQTFVKIPVDQADIQEGNGSVTVPVSFTGPVPDEDGTINVDVFAAAIETNLDGTELTTDNNMVIKGTSVEMEKTDMVVEDPNLVTGDAVGYEDNAIALNIDASLTDTDGSETMSVTISGVPEGARLSAGTDNGDGTWSLSEGDLEGLTVTPPTDSDVDFDLSVAVTSTEESTGETATVESTFTVEVDAVADTTTVSASVEAKLVQNEQSDGLSDVTVTNEGMESASYHNTYGYYIKDEDGNPQSGGIVFADTKDGVGDSFTIEDVDADNIGYFIIPNGDNKNDNLANGDAVTFEQDDSGNWHVVDADGDRLVGTRDPVLFSDPELNENNFDYTTDNAVEGNQNWEDIKGGGDNDFNDVNMNVVVTPNEPVATDPHCEVTVNVDATFGDYSDGSENHFVVVEVPEGWEPQGEYTEVDSSAYGEGNFIAVQVNPADLQSGDGAVSVPVVFEVPATEAADDVDLDVFAIAQEVNIDGTVGDGEITLDNNNTMSQATVTVEGKDLTAEPPEVVAADAQGYEDSAIPLSIDASLADTDGSESLSVTISGVPEGASLSAGTDNGDGTWTLEEGDLEGLTVTPPTDSDVDFDLSISVTSTEASTGATSTVDTSMTVEVDAVADGTTVSASVDAKLLQPEGPETEGGVIDTHNFGETDSGFRVVGRDIDGEVDADNVVASGGSLGVGGAAVGNVVPNQIGHNPETGEAEGMIVEFDNDVSEVSFSVSRLFENEGDNRGDAAGDEQGKVILYRDGEVVGEVEFTADSGNTGSFTVQTDDGGSFDAIEFTATEYSEGDGTQTRDSSDYFVDEIAFTHAEPPVGDQDPSCEVTVNIDATFGDYSDGSENHFVVVEVPEGWEPQGEGFVEVDSSAYGEGNFIAVQVDPTDLQENDGAISVPVVFVVPATEAADDVDLDVFAVAQEVNIDGTVGDGEITLDNNNTMSQATITVEGKDISAAPPEVVAADASGYEDNAIALNIDANLTDTDGSESMSITISGVPEGASLSAGTDNGDGTWTLEEGDLEGLTVTPPADSDVDFDLGVSVTSTEASSGDTSTVETSLTVEVDAVADDTSVSASVEAQLIEGEATEGVAFTLGGRETDGSKSEMFESFDQEVGGHNISVTAIKVDGSEGQLDGDVKGGEWRGIGVKGEGDTEIDYDKNGDEGSEQIAIDFDGMELNELTVGFKALFNEGEVADGQETGQWVAYHNGEPVGSGEFDAASNAGQTDGALEINIGPDDLGEGVVFDEIRFEAAESGSDFLVQYVEGEKPGMPADPQCEVTVNVDATFGDYSDGSENHFVVVEVPEGWDPQGEYVEVDSSAYGEGNFIAVQVDANDLQENNGAVSVPVTFVTPAEGSDIDVKVFAVAQEVNIDGTVGDGEITLDNNNTQSGTTVTIEGKDLTAEPPEVVVADAEGYEDNAIPLSIDANLADTDGSESLSITISGVPEGASLSAGTDNGDGTWTLEESDLDGLTVTPPTDSDVDFDLSVSVTSTEASTGDTSTVEQTFTVEVDAVADTTSVSAEISAEVIPGEAGEPQEITIGADNYDAADAGFTVAGRTIGGDGNLTDASTDQISVKSTGSPTGFGVKGDVGNGADSEIGYEDGKSEQVVINFDEDVSSADVTIAWQNPNEDCRVTLYRDGEPVGEIVVEGGTDRVDALGQFKADDGGTFDSMVFEATGDNSDFLIHEVSFETVGESSPPTCEIEVDVSATFGDYTDGSEEHFVFVEVPQGMSPTDEDAVTVEGDAQNGLPAGQTFVKIPVDASVIEEGEGSVTVPVSFTGPVPEGDEAINVEVFAGAVETNLDGTELTTENNMSLTGTSVELEKADITVSDPDMQVDDSSGLEDTAIPLDLNISLTDTDGSESMSVTISSVPNGATLSAGTDNGDGSYTLEEGDLEGLTITPPSDSDVDFDLQVQVAVTEESTGETKTFSEDVKVEVIADADAPTLNASLSVASNEDADDDKGSKGGSGANNGFGNGDQDAPGNSLENNNAENSQGGSGSQTSNDFVDNGGQNHQGTNSDDNFVVDRDIRMNENFQMGNGDDSVTVNGDTSGGNNFNMGNGDDSLTINGDIDGNTAMDGGNGDDVLYLEGDRESYTFRNFTNNQGRINTQIIDNDTGDTLTVNNVEAISFGDGEVVGNEDLVQRDADAELSSTTYDLDVESALADVDGSESLSIAIGPVPEGVTFSAGTDNGDGTWSVTAEDLQDLQMTVDASVKADFNLPITATSTEAENGDSETVNLALEVELPEEHGQPIPPVGEPQQSGHGKGDDSDQGKSGSGSGHGKGQGSDKGKSGSGSGHGKGQKSDKGKSGSGSGHGKGQKSDKGKSGSGSGHGKGQNSDNGKSGSGHGKGKGQSGSGQGKGHGSGHGKGMSGSGQGIAAAGMDDDNNLQGGDIAAAIDKFSNAAPEDDNGNQDAFRNVGASNNAGDQNNWFDEQQDQTVDDEVFGKTELEQKEEEDQQAKDAEQEEQDTGLQIPADDNSNNEADFEDRSLV